MSIYTKFLTPSPYHDNTIAQLAYYKAHNRGFEDGHELNDWLEAERDLLF